MSVIYSLLFAIAAVHFSYGQTSCPPSVGKELNSCAISLMGYIKAAPENRREKCGEVRAALDCIRTTIAKCDSEAIEQYLPFQGWLDSIGRVEQDVDSVCNNAIPDLGSVEEGETEPSNAIERCSKKDQKQLRRCSRKLKRFAAESPIRCQKVRKSMDCMVNLLERCRSTIKRKTFRKLNRVRNDLMDTCVETNEIDEEIDEDVTAPPVSEIRTTLRPPPPPKPSRCPPNAFEKVTECSASLQSVNPSQGKDVMCSTLKGSVQCLEDIVDRCIAETGMEAVASMLGKTKTYVQEQCKINTSPGKCPADYITQIQGCTDAMKGLTPGASKAEQCRVMKAGMLCFGTILEDCQDVPEVADMTRMMNIDYMRTVISDHCSGKPITIPENGGESNENCPIDYNKRIQRCAKQVQDVPRVKHSLSEAQVCSMATDALGCLGELLTNCGGKPEVQMMNGAINMDEIQTTLDTHCAKYLGNLTEGNEGCPADYEEQIMGCARRMQSMSPTSGREEQCRVVKSSLECVGSILGACEGVPEVDDVTKVMKLETLQTMVANHCAGKPIPIPETGGETNENCPADYEEVIKSCAAPMRGLINMDEASDQLRACSIASDGLGCLDQIFKDCGGEEKVRIIQGTMNIEEMQVLIDSHCAPFLGNGTGSAGNCPPTYRQDIVNCALPLENIGELQDIEQICSRLSGALNCVDNFLDICSDMPDVQAMPPAMNFDQVRNLVKSTCPKDGDVSVDEEGCPSNYLFKMNNCSNQMKSFMVNGDHRDMEMVCSVARDGFGCLKEILRDCRDKPAIQQFNGIMNLDEIHRMVEDECSKGTLIQNEEAENCKYGDPNSQLLDCNRLMNVFTNGDLSLDERCGNVTLAFDCLGDLMENCEDNEDIIKFKSVVNMDNVRQALKPVCGA